MAHNHEHSSSNYNQAFAVGIGLNIGFVILEAGFGVWANSMALLADAGHNLSDVLGLLLAWGATYLAARRPTPRRTYGLRRSTIIAALLNAVLLLLVMGGIAWEAVQRFWRPEPIAAVTVMWVAIAGVIVNTATALLFMAGRKHDLNIRGAFLHMVADAAVSVGVVLAGLIIRYTAWDWVDSVTSLFVVGVIAIGTWGLFRESLDLALDAAPVGIDMTAVEKYLAGLPGITNVHDLHVWSLSTTEVALTVHLTKPDGCLDDGLLGRATKDLQAMFGIAHSTIQLEQSSDHSCSLERA